MMPLGDITGKIVTGFGNTMKGIGIVIGLGIILGKILAEAYATDQIADSMVKTVGEKHASLATTLTGYLVSIPVFFDAAFVILTPLNHQLSRRTKTPYITMLTGLAIGLISTHAMVIPTPGPVAVAGNMNVDLGHVHAVRHHRLPARGARRGLDLRPDPGEKPAGHQRADPRRRPRVRNRRDASRPCRWPSSSCSSPSS